MKPASSLRSSHAQIERTEQVSGLRLIECRYHPDLRMPKHWHDYAHFVLVLEGACIDACRGGSHRYAPSQLVFYPAGEPHASHFQRAGTRTFEIQMDREWLQRVGEYSLRVDDPCGFAGGLPVWIGTRIYNEFREIDAMTPLAVQGLALELLAETSRRGGSEN